MGVGLGETVWKMQSNHTRAYLSTMESGDANITEVSLTWGPLASVPPSYSQVQVLLCCALHHWI